MRAKRLFITGAVILFGLCLPGTPETSIRPVSRVILSGEEMQYYHSWIQNRRLGSHHETRNDCRGCCFGACGLWE